MLTSVGELPRRGGRRGGSARATSLFEKFYKPLNRRSVFPDPFLGLDRLNRLEKLLYRKKPLYGIKRVTLIQGIHRKRPTQKAASLDRVACESIAKKSSHALPALSVEGDP